MEEKIVKYLTEAFNLKVKYDDMKKQIIEFLMKDVILTSRLRERAIDGILESYSLNI